MLWKESVKRSWWLDPASIRVATHSLSKGREPLLLSVGVDVRANGEGDDVEEGNPGLLREEFLGKGQSNWGGNPTDFHDRPETGLDSGTNLVPRASTSNDCHGCQIDRVLDRRDLRFVD